MRRGLRLRDYLLGPPEPPPGGEERDVEALMREVAEMEDLDIEEVARLCGRSQARVWERSEESMRDGGMRGE